MRSGVIVARDCCPRAFNAVADLDFEGDELAHVFPSGVGISMFIP